MHLAHLAATLVIIGKVLGKNNALADNIFMCLFFLDVNFIKDKPLSADPCIDSNFSLNESCNGNSMYGFGTFEINS